MRKCAIVDDAALERLALRYMGIGKELIRDEQEILIFALYCESEQRPDGLINRAVRGILRETGVIR